MPRAANRSTVAGVPGGSGQAWPQADEVRRLVPAFALAIAIVAAVTDPKWSADLILAAPPVAVFAVWTYGPRAPLWAVSLAVVCPVVVAQRSGQLEPLLFEVVLLAFVVGCWAPSQAEAVALGLLALVAPVGASVIQDPSIFVGIWLIGIAFPWLIGRAAARQWQLANQLVAIRRELAEHALLDERRRIARDVHDLVGHGLASVMRGLDSTRDAEVQGSSRER
jgi:signal transduction histidine kinase